MLGLNRNLTADEATYEAKSKKSSRRASRDASQRSSRRASRDASQASSASHSRGGGAKSFKYKDGVGATKSKDSTGGAAQFYNKPSERAPKPGKKAKTRKPKSEDLIIHL